MNVHEEIRRQLAAYLDNELTQGESQRVRVHLEDCLECRQAFDEMREIQTITASLKFVGPPEEVMQELEDKLSVRVPRRLGWMLVIGGAAAWLLYAGVTAVLHARMPTWKELISGAVLVGFLLLFISILLERLAELPRDRYRRVKQ